jgi:hypothetical protein
MPDNSDLASQSHDLLQEQKQSWEMLAKGYASLDAVQTRSIPFDGFEIKLQFNPGRIISSAAKVDPKSIAERKCFLCPANLPPVQRSVPFRDDYLVLCNPFPIFPEHFTIPHREHTPQRIAPSFGAMIDLAKAMKRRYTIFYNGPKCGASAPDHLHFQAGNKGFMTIDREYERIKKERGEVLTASAHLDVYAVGNYLRNFISLESNDRAALLDGFEAFYEVFLALSPAAEEPMLNVLASFEKGQWRIILFPRARHRPSFYFAEGDEKILLSPASVDLGGVCITPVEKDFHRVTKETLVQMCNEVCLSKADFAALSKRYAETLHG